MFPLFVDRGVRMAKGGFLGVAATKRWQLFSLGNRSGIALDASSARGTLKIV
jgi:hypothetical protein